MGVVAGYRTGSPSAAGQLEWVQVHLPQIALPELPAHRTVVAFDSTIELGRVGRQHVQGDCSVLAGKCCSADETDCVTELGNWLKWCTGGAAHADVW